MFNRNLFMLFSSMLFMITGFSFANLRDIKISEIHYHPLNEGENSGTGYEFIEIKNIGDSSIDLTHIAFTNGILYSFATGTKIESNSFIVLASDSIYFKERYGFSPFDTYADKLANSGEKITIKDTLKDSTIASFEYKDKTPWPVSADGLGFSLVPVNISSTDNPGMSSYWRASSKIHGSPGTDDLNLYIDPVYVNEVLTHTDTPVVDAIELYNPNSKTVDISGWYITDDKSKPKKFKIPANTTISAGGYISFVENDFNANPGTDASFSFNSHGDRAYLYSATAKDSLTGYSHGFSFGEIENWYSFGQYRTSTGDIHFVIQKEITLGKENTGPRVGPLVISEIMYNPINGHEYIELTNISSKAVRLYDPKNPKNTWKIRGLKFSFPENISIAIGGIILVVSDTIKANDFRTLYSVPAEVQIFNDTGNLDNKGETITLLKPEDPYIPDSTKMTIKVPYMDIDKVQYNDKAPWPIDADGNGASLERKNLFAYGNDPVNWIAKAGTPGVPIVNHSHIKSPQNRVTFSIYNSLTQNSAISINFTIPVDDEVELMLYDMQGRLLKTLYRGVKEAGSYQMNFKKSQFAAGTHIFRLKTIRTDVVLFEKVVVLN